MILFVNRIKPSSIIWCYNSRELNEIWERSHDKKNIFIVTAIKFYNYPHHDIWHLRLGRIMSRRELHRRVDCQITTLYGGICGILWNELFFNVYRKYAVNNNVDWLEYMKSKTHFIPVDLKCKWYSY